MHDALFENQSRLDDALAFELAHELGLDLGRFTADLRAHRFEGRIRKDQRSGEKSGVDSTPTFFINGRYYEGSWDERSLLNAIDRVIKVSRRREDKEADSDELESPAA